MKNLVIILALLITTSCYDKSQFYGKELTYSQAIEYQDVECDGNLVIVDINEEEGTIRIVNKETKESVIFYNEYKKNRDVTQVFFFWVKSCITYFTNIFHL